MSIYKWLGGMCSNSGKKELKNHLYYEPIIISVKADSVLFPMFLMLPESLICMYSIYKVNNLKEQYRCQATCDLNQMGKTKSAFKNFLHLKLVLSLVKELIPQVRLHLFHDFEEAMILLTGVFTWLHGTKD